MILVDIHVLVAWLDSKHPSHGASVRAIEACAAVEELAISTLTLAEMAASGRREADLMEDLRGFTVLPLEPETALRAGREFVRQSPGGRAPRLSMADCLFWSQAVQLRVPILTLPSPQLRRFPKVNIFVPVPEKCV